MPSTPTQVRRVVGTAVSVTGRELDISELDFIDHKTLLTLDEVARSGASVRLRGARSIVHRVWKPARPDDTCTGVLLMATHTVEATAEGYVHEVGFYASDAEFADLVVPFAHEGLRSRRARCLRL